MNKVVYFRSSRPNILVVLKVFSSPRLEGLGESGLGMSSSRGSRLFEVLSVNEIVFVSFLSRQICTYLRK